MHHKFSECICVYNGLNEADKNDFNHQSLKSLMGRGNRVKSVSNKAIP